MPFITDGQGRIIKIHDDSTDVFAEHDGRRIGIIEFSEVDEETSLWGMDVVAAYRRAGIATAMMNHAVTIHGRAFRKPNFSATGCDHAPSHSYYTQEGAEFIRSCIEKGILDDTEELDDPNSDGQ